MKRNFLQLSILLLLLQFAIIKPIYADDHSVHHSSEHKHWGYTGDVSPAHWHELDPAFAIAKDGKSQSPIDITTKNLAVSSSLKKPVFHYSSDLFGIENNGHTIQIDPLHKNGYVSLNYITLDGADFFVQQAHLHSPSEHLIDGKMYEIELHIVHKNARGDVAVVGIMIEEGAENKTLADAFANLPKHNTEGKILDLPSLINFGELLANNATVYRYDGSLTTPPCSEGVLWNVFAKPITMSKSQIDAFKAIYFGNNRPCQPLNNRPISKTE
ncbi:MAG: carbonic anhydrase family protein [Ignavibacteria bacterium]|jgi:carbonic anhydrase|nr:carbonic anhydrase family protein [Ignavibacteria bacterium]